MSVPGGRAPSGPWGRLKPVTLDPLETIGLPSKGDNRLLNFKTQEGYYTKIVEKYLAFCSDAGRGDELLRRLAKLDVSKENERTTIIERPKTAPPTSNTTAIHFPTDAVSEKDMSILVMAMRKLREGIVASHRVDDFAIQAYIFCIRLSILLKHMESYHPALLHLLKKMHTVHPLSNVELQEFVGYLVLDLSCRQGDLAGAYSIRSQYKLNDAKVDAVLRSLAHDEYFLFWRVKHNVDGHKAKLMEFAEEGIRTQSLKALGRSYLSIDLKALENITNAPWAILQASYAVGWELDGSKVIIRKPRTR